jgi:hypothetical protein
MEGVTTEAPKVSAPAKQEAPANDFPPVEAYNGEAPEDDLPL